MCDDHMRLVCQGLELRRDQIAIYCMHVDPNSPQRMGEQRRYFPDWTRRGLVAADELECDRNSYLAGGYAEEFGYLAEPGWSRGVPLLDGEPPEYEGEWLAIAIDTHPGYPVRPHPLLVEFRIELRSAPASMHMPQPPRESSFPVHDHMSADDQATRMRLLRTRANAFANSLRWMLGRGL